MTASGGGLWPRYVPYLRPLGFFEFNFGVAAIWGPQGTSPGLGFENL